MSCILPQLSFTKYSYYYGRRPLKDRPSPCNSLSKGDRQIVGNSTWVGVLVHPSGRVLPVASRRASTRTLIAFLPHSVCNARRPLLLVYLFRRMCNSSRASTLTCPLPGAEICSNTRLLQRFDSSTLASVLSKQVAVGG